MSNLTKILNVGYGSNPTGPTVAMPVTAQGQVDPVPCGAVESIFIDIQITAFSGSTSITFSWYRVDPVGVSYIVWSSTAQTSTGKLSADIGPGLTTTADPGAEGYLGWQVAGSPSVTFRATVYGK